jgi:hypothetical protein
MEPTLDLDVVVKIKLSTAVESLSWIIQLSEPQPTNDSYWANHLDGFKALFGYSCGMRGNQRNLYWGLRTTDVILNAKQTCYSYLIESDKWNS